MKSLLTLRVHMLLSPLSAVSALQGTLSSGSCSAVRWRTAASAAVAVRLCEPHPLCSSHSPTLRVASVVYPVAGLGRLPQIPCNTTWNLWGCGWRGELEVSGFSSDKTGKNYDFAQVLKRSVCLEQNTQAWCDSCERYQPTVSNMGSASLRALP